MIDEPIDPSLWGEMEDEVYEVMPDDIDQDEDEDEEEEGEKKKESEQNEEEEEEEGDVDETTAGLKTPGEGYNIYLFEICPICCFLFLLNKNICRITTLYLVLN